MVLIFFSNDLAGQEDYETLRPLSYNCADIFLVAFSLVRPTSLENVSLQWIPEVRHYCPDTPLILVGTQKDLRDNNHNNNYNDYNTHNNYNNHNNSEVTTLQGQELARQIRAIEYIECSALTGENLKEVFDAATRFILLGKEKKKKRRCIVM